jgi:hypothetical protein
VTSILIRMNILDDTFLSRRQEPRNAPPWVTMSCRSQAPSYFQAFDSLSYSRLLSLVSLIVVLPPWKLFICVVHIMSSLPQFFHAHVCMFVKFSVTGKLYRIYLSVFILLAENRVTKRRPGEYPHTVRKSKKLSYIDTI